MTSECPDYATIRERAFKQVEDHPEHIDAIAHNLSAALMLLDVPATTWQATMDELNRRWEFRIRKSSASGGRK
jgi:hypothetical protein